MDYSGGPIFSWTAAGSEMESLMKKAAGQLRSPISAAAWLGFF